MAKDFDKDELPSFITEISPGKYPSNEDMDHLTYLEKGPSLFEDEEDDNMREWRLVCASTNGDILLPFSSVRLFSLSPVRRGWKERRGYNL